MANSNKVKFGLSNVHIFKLTETITSTGVVCSYGTPFALPGAVSLSLTQQGDMVKEFADDIVYYTSAMNNGYSGDLEIERITDQFEKEILNYEEDSNGVIVENADKDTSYFGMTFQVNGDKSATKYVLYRNKVSRPDLNANTKSDSTSFDHDTLNIESTPDSEHHYVKAHTADGDTTSTTYTGWDTAIYFPV